MSEERRFKLGDTVRLRSGGPIMTINAKMSGGDWRCQWFSGGGNKLEHADFADEALEAANPHDKVRIVGRPLPQLSE